MYGCESWTIKKGECRRINAFKLWCWRRLLRDARRSNQSILKEISPEYSLEGLMLKLKLQYFGHLMRRTDSLEKTLMLGRIEGRRRDDSGWDGWMISPLWQKWRASWWRWKRRVKSWLKTQHSKNEDHGIQSHHFMANRWGENGNNERLYFGRPQNHCRWWLQPWNYKMLTPWKKSYDQPRQHIKKQRHYFANKGLSSQEYGFSSHHVWMWVGL